MKPFKLLPFCILIAISGHAQQKLIAKMVGVYKAPRWETVDKIKEVVRTDSAAYDALYFIKSYNDFQYFNQNHLLSFPGVYIFDKNLRPVKEIASTDCGWQAMQFISTLTDSTVTVSNDSIKFKVKDLLRHGALIAGDSNILENKDFDYLYVYTWVSYLPKFTKDQFKYSLKINENTNQKIKIISLNADFMAMWNESPEKLIGKKVKNLPQ